jgi:putative SOS response-associated peptidase YedK
MDLVVHAGLQLHCRVSEIQFAGRIHDRMPVLLKAGEFWDMAGLLCRAGASQACKQELLRFWPVSKYVNRLGNDEDVRLIDPIEVAGL